MLPSWNASTMRCLSDRRWHRPQTANSALHRIRDCRVASWHLIFSSCKFEVNMDDDIRKSERGGNTAYLNIGAWFDQKAGHIHLTLPRSDWFHTTVAPGLQSKRGHPNLYNTRALSERPVPRAPNRRQRQSIIAIEIGFKNLLYSNVPRAAGYCGR